MIPVGLATISSIVFEDKVNNVDSSSPVSITKGEKLGHFAYGGSMILLIFEKYRFPDLKSRQGLSIGNMIKVEQKALTNNN